MSSELEERASRYAPAVARALLQAARAGGTEADFRREAARILEGVGLEAGLTLAPRDEFSVARGRVDSLYNRVVLEYKRPGTLAPSNRARVNRSVIDQVQGYILDVARRERREASRLAGVITDGSYFVFVRRVGEGWSVDEPLPVNESSVHLFLRLLFSLAAGAALVPDNLLADFGPRTDAAKRSVRALYRALRRSEHRLVRKLFEQWRVFFGEATDYREWATRLEGKEEFRSFVRGMGLDPEDAEPSYVLFSIHTYYALLIKLIACLAASHFAGNSRMSLPELASAQGGDLREALVSLERGGLFREYGIRNFLEGDFFGWYLPAWDEDVEWAAGSLARQLARYDPDTLELAPENARDLLKKLYHYLLPREIRHDLGEYYTPDWLAERLIRTTLGDADLGNPRKRVLDPACGSGTFLVILIRFIRERASRRGEDPATTLDLTLQNVVGIDLNPLAVIAARTNYLLALGDLLKARRGDIFIPVYQADSVLTPERGKDIFEGNVYPLKTVVGTFRVPVYFAERQRLDALTGILDEAVQAGVSEEGFAARVARAGLLEPEEFANAEVDMRALYRQLRDLHAEGIDGVWARIIQNAFAPLFLEPCHYVVGNPPWVNWENLPDEYRLGTRPLWESYGLFPHGGMDTILGKGKKDISMLMTYVAVQRYLRQGGRLGFLLSQSLFKTSGAGQGFRRFRLPDGTPFGPLVVEDMSELDPFEGATNRTAVAVFARGHPVRYPVSYQYWKKRHPGRKGSIGFDTPYAAVTREKITYREWLAEPVDAQDPTSAWLTGRQWAIHALRKIMGPSSYTAHEGSNTGGANAVFWVEIVGTRPGGLAIISNLTEGARRQVARTQAAVEADLLYPLLRGRDVTRWSARPSAHILMTQDPTARRGIAVAEMEAKYPRTHLYLRRFEAALLARKDRGTRGLIEKGAPFWTVFGVADYTLAPWKVVWREVADELDAAVVGEGEVLGTPKPVVPDHTCILVECGSEEEAHYLCAVLNSSPVRLAVRNYIVLHPDPHVLERVRVPRFSEKGGIHLRLAALSREAHGAVQEGDLARVARAEGEVDRWVARLWGLSEEEMGDIRRSLEEI